MIRKRLRSMTIVLPPAWAVGTFLFCFSVARVSGIVCREALHGCDPATLASVMHPFFVVETGTAAFAAALFAVWRIRAFHPIADTEYRRWLERAPWVPDKPLPMGSILPGFVDVGVVGLLCWLGRNVWPPSAYIPAISYLAGLTVVTCVVAAFTRQQVVLYALLFGVGLAIRWAADPVYPLLALAVLLPLTIVGLRVSLEPKRWPAFTLSLQTLSDDRKEASKELGWPFGFLGPRPAPRLIVWPDTLAISLMAGWYLHAMLSHAVLEAEQDRNLASVFAIGLVLAALGRTLGYVLRYAAPITLFGRILTGRWILPRYDRVFAASLWAVIAIAIGEALIIQFAIPTAIGQPLMVGLTIYLLMAIGPTVRNWQLTGGHRINPAAVCNKASPYVKVS